MLGKEQIVKLERCVGTQAYPKVVLISGKILATCQTSSLESRGIGVESTRCKDQTEGASKRITY